MSVQFHSLKKLAKEVAKAANFSQTDELVNGVKVYDSISELPASNGVPKVAQVGSDLYINNGISISVVEREKKLYTLISRKRNNQTVLFGNSIVAGVSGHNILNSATINLSPNLQLLSNLGIAGNNTTQMLARVDTIPTTTEFVFILEGPNDAGSSITVETHYSNLKAICVYLLDRNIIPVLLASSPKNTNTDYIASYLFAEQYLAEQLNISFIDMWDSIVDTTTGGYSSGLTSDGVHPTYAASVTASANLVSIISSQTTQRLFVPRSGAAGISGYLLSGGNCLMLTDTNADGAPDGLDKIGSTPPTYSLEAAPAGFKGNFAVQTSNGAGGNPYLRKRISSGFSIGDVIRISCAIDYTYASSSNATITISGAASGDIFSNVSYDITATNFIKDFTITSIGNLDILFTIANSGIGGILKVGELEVYNLSKLNAL